MFVTYSCYVSGINDTCEFLIRQIQCSIYIYIGVRLYITVGIQEEYQLQQKDPVKAKLQIPKVTQKRRAK